MFISNGTPLVLCCALCVCLSVCIAMLSDSDLLVKSTHAAFTTHGSVAQVKEALMDFTLENVTPLKSLQRLLFQQMSFQHSGPMLPAGWPLKCGWWGKMCSVICVMMSVQPADII